MATKKTAKKKTTKRAPALSPRSQRLLGYREAQKHIQRMIDNGEIKVVQPGVDNSHAADAFGYATATVGRGVSMVSEPYEVNVFDQLNQVASQQDELAALLEGLEHRLSKILRPTPPKDDVPFHDSPRGPTALTNEVALRINAQNALIINLRALMDRIAL